MITADTALSKATAYVEANRPGVKVVGLYQDEQDYLAALEYEGQPRVGEGWIFVNKSRGEVREVAPGAGVDKAYKMTPVPSFQPF